MRAKRASTNHNMRFDVVPDANKNCQNQLAAGGGTGQQVTRVTIFGPTSQWTPSASAHWHCSASSDPSSSSSRGSRSPALSFGSRRSAPREVVRGGCWAGSRRRIWAKGTGVFLAFFLSLGTFYDLHFFFFSLFPHFSFLTPLRLGLCLRGSPSSVRLGFLSKYIPLYTPFCLSSSPPTPPLVLCTFVHFCCASTISWCGGGRCFNLSSLSSLLQIKKKTKITRARDVCLGSARASILASSNGPNI